MCRATLTRLPRSWPGWIALFGYTVSAAAANVTVPPGIQARFIGKAPAYDRGFRERTGGRVRVVVVVREDDAESVRSGSNIKSALERLDKIAGLPHEVALKKYTSAAELAKELEKDRVSLLYVTPGLDDEVAKVCSMARDLRVITVTAVPEYVRRCVVLGLDVVSGKPKLLVNLEAAKASGIRFSSEFLRLAKVYR